MTTTSPAVMAPSASASRAFRSPSKTRAVPVKVESSKPALFTTAPSGASVPLRMVSPPVAWIGRSSWRRISPSSGFGSRSARFSAIDAVEVGPHEATERLHVGQVRDRPPDAREVVEGQVDLRLAGDGQQVEHSVGRAAERHRHGDRVLEGGAGHDLTGGDALTEHVDHGLARLV